MDIKAIASLAKRKNNSETVDGLRDTNADYGKKAHRGVKEDGTMREKDREMVRIQSAFNR